MRRVIGISGTLLGMRPRAQDDIDQHRGIGTDRLGLMADALVGPVAIAPVGGGHMSGTVLGRCGRRLRRWLATRLPRWKISTVAAVMRASTSWRISGCGTL